MDTKEEHIRYNVMCFGEGFADVTNWIDKYVKTHGRGHRRFRHDLKTTPDEAVKYFIEETKKYLPSSEDKIRFVVKGHIACDKIRSAYDKKLKAMSDVKERLTERFTIRVTEKMYEWLTTIGSSQVRAILQNFLDGDNLIKKEG